MIASNVQSKNDWLTTDTLKITRNPTSAFFFSPRMYNMTNHVKLECQGKSQIQINYLRARQNSTRTASLSFSTLTDQPVATPGHSAIGYSSNPSAQNPRVMHDLHPHPKATWMEAWMEGMELEAKQRSNFRKRYECICGFQTKDKRVLKGHKARGCLTKPGCVNNDRERNVKGVSRNLPARSEHSESRYIEAPVKIEAKEDDSWLVEGVEEMVGKSLAMDRDKPTEADVTPIGMAMRIRCHWAKLRCPSCPFKTSQYWSLKCHVLNHRRLHYRQCGKCFVIVVSDHQLKIHSKLHRQKI